MENLRRHGYFKVVIITTLGIATIVSFFIIKLTSSERPNAEPLATSSNSKSIPSIDPIDSMFQSVNGVVGDEFNAKYVQLLLAHHAIGSAMAEQVKDSGDKEVRDVTAYILKANTLNNEKLRAWAKVWGVAVNEPSQKDVQTIISDLTSNNGEERDHQFVLDIIDHFSGSVILSKLAVSNSNNDELKEFAKDLVNAESAQAETLQKWARTVSFDSDDRQSYSHDKHDNY